MVESKNKGSGIRSGRDEIQGNFDRKRSSVDSNNPNQLRKSHIIRQINEGVLGVRNEDYDENG